MNRKTEQRENEDQNEYEMTPEEVKYIYDRIKRSKGLYDEVVSMFRAKGVTSVNDVLHNVLDAAMMIATGMIGQTIHEGHCEEKKAIDSMVAHLNQWVENFEILVNKCDLSDINNATGKTDVVADNMLKYMTAQGLSEFSQLQESLKKKEGSE
jgi:hypothetical protein